MQVTYIDHSCFCVELREHILLFDYFRGTLPRFNNHKKIISFSSHAHPDHFVPELFHVLGSYDQVTFVVSKDIKNKHRNEIQKQIEAGRSIITAGADDMLHLHELNVKTLRSTDEGIAFLINVEGLYIFHAGDLNWWHWMGETKSYNNNMAADFKREIDKIHDQMIDIAFFPVDPRLEEAYRYGVDYFLKNTRTRYLLPMHCWDQYEIIKKYKNEAEEKYQKSIILIQHKGETFELDHLDENRTNY